MDSSFRERGFNTQKASTGFQSGLKILVSLINWLTNLIKLTEKEQEDAGIYLDRPGGE
jgi:hypothetical protein